MKADELATLARRLAMDGVPPAGPLVMMNESWEVKGPVLFDKHCAGCHTLQAAGASGTTGPNLDDVIGTVMGKDNLKTAAGIKHRHRRLVGPLTSLEGP